MKIIGLSASIASGKNFIAEIFAENGCAIFDADAEVHELLASHKLTILEVKKHFPESFIDKKIDRKILGKIVFENQKKLQILEKIIHQKVRQNYQDFLKKAQKNNIEFVVLNIPLLLESKGYECDYIVAIIAKRSEQIKRFVAREKLKNLQSLTKDLKQKFKQIIAKQVSNQIRKKHADFIIQNDCLKSDAEKQVKEILKKIK